MKNKNKPFKEIENSSLKVLLKTGIQTDINGNVRVQGEWVECPNPVSLGSMVEPNEDILQFKMNIPPKEPDNIFSGLFRR